MKKILSYLLPFTKKVESINSGTLEINWIDGKKRLDSKNANYSFGSLQQVLTVGLSRLTIHPTSDTLLLGLGAGSILRPLREKFHCHGKVTAVEFDQAIIDIARDEFDISAIESLEIIHADALEYVNQCDERFDLIIVDLFIDAEVPPVFYSLEFWDSIAQLISANGQILFNAGINNSDDKRVDSIINYLKGRIEFNKYDNVKGINTLLLGRAY